MDEQRSLLRRRVERRRRQLEEALWSLDRDGHAPERRADLKREITEVDDAVRSGWDRMSEAGSWMLRNWLQVTQPLIDPR